MAGATVAARHRGIPVLLDGFIATAAVVPLHLLVLERLTMRAGHGSAEPGHERQLDAIGKELLLTLDLRLGEGSGVVIATPIVQAACAAVVRSPPSRSLDSHELPARLGVPDPPGRCSSGRRAGAGHERAMVPGCRRGDRVRDRDGLARPERTRVAAHVGDDRRDGRCHDPGAFHDIGLSIPPIRSAYTRTSSGNHEGLGVGTFGVLALVFCPEPGCVAALGPVEGVVALVMAHAVGRSIATIVMASFCRLVDRPRPELQRTPAQAGGVGDQCRDRRLQRRGGPAGFVGYGLALFGALLIVGLAGRLRRQPVTCSARSNRSGRWRCCCGSSSRRRARVAG